MLIYCTSSAWFSCRRICPSWDLAVDPSPFFRHDLLFYLENLRLNCLSKFVKQILHLCSIKGALLDLVLDEFGNRDGKSRGIDHPCRGLANSLGLGYTLFHGLR